MRRVVPPAARSRLATVIELGQRASAVRLLPVERQSGRDAAFVCIYRARNTPLVLALLAQLPDAEVRLWALDETTLELQPWTDGSGRGTRLELLNRLIASLDRVPKHLVVSDDDVDIVVGDLGRLLGAGEALGFHLFQPAHTRRSHAALPFARMHMRRFARETTFVEQGPLVVMSAAAQRVLLPLPEHLGMGFGVELGWQRAMQAAGLRSGIIDAVGIRHRELVGLNYDREQQRAQLRELLEAAGYAETADAQQVVRWISVPSAWSRVRGRTP